MGFHVSAKVERFPIMSTSADGPADLFFAQMEDLCGMESQLAGHLLELEAAAADPMLAELLGDYARKVSLHHQEILGLFHHHRRDTGNNACKGIEGLVEEGKAHIASVPEGGTRDLMIIAHVLRVLAYGNAAYEITSRLAGQLDLAGDAGVLMDLRQGGRRAAEDILALQPPIFETAFRRP